LEEEAQLLATAQQRISQGDARGALSALGAHQKQFPRGALSLERQATFAIAHCLSGQTSRGRGEAERFRRKHPSSPMVKRLESACKLESP
jgi:outer membrane protein assembly factor BamD (BamD/ComL family)